jgi:hypothetical protein
MSDERLVVYSSLIIHHTSLNTPLNQTLQSQVLVNSVDKGGIDEATIGRFD